jgi:hypothetical protein
MKTKHPFLRGLLAVLFVISLLCLAFAPALSAAPPLTQTRPFTVNATNQAPSLIGIGPVGTNDLLQLRQGSNKRFVVPSNGVPTFAQSGTVVTVANGSVTNTFSFPYASAPIVVARQRGEATTTTNTLVVTTTNFVLTTSKATQTNDWIAIGPPAGTN